MDTELLRTFLEVQKTRHFGKAAENLYLTQSAVSARIRQLEVHLGVPLFSRHRHNLKLTPGGERLLPHAEAVLTAWERAKQVAVINETQQAQIAIGATPNIWDILLHESINQVFGSTPSLAIRAESLSTEIIPRRLLERSLDLAIILDPPKVDELSYEMLASLELMLVGNKVAYQDGNPQINRWIMMDWGVRFGIELSKQLTNPPPILHTNNTRIALDFLLTSGGCVYLPISLVSQHIESGAIKVFKNAPVITRHIYAAWHLSSDYLEQIEQLTKQIKRYICASETKK
ncbi:LysR family transcriptional regulator [Endozoicomonas sp. SM1973]|uniref:LysR family transcriptional regulator n=1 Tax=Spartinivicinus marinus TaxID=2994442 RepID=A0A853IFS5_9GAMM|nr:LysR family transcriptional regulator [Spartinivicinus marinus]NYZ68831.1 LysR family transcriptional regulator [Spartinivicinus marinus]